MPNCLRNTITPTPPCDKVGGGLEYIVGFDWDSFKSQYSTKHGTPEQHLQEIVDITGEEYLNDLMAMLAKNGIVPTRSNRVNTGSFSLGNTSSLKPVGSGILAESSTKLVYLEKIISAVAVAGTYSINLTVVNGIITTNYTITATIYSAGLIEFPVPNGEVKGNKIFASWAQPTPVFPYQKNVAYCKPCGGSVARLGCPDVRDITSFISPTSVNISEFHGGNGIVFGAGCECDYECYLSKKIGVTSDIRALHALYIERRLKLESINSQNQSLSNYSETVRERLKEVNAEIEKGLARQLARIIPVIRKDGEACFSCGYGTVQKVSNI